MLRLLIVDDEPETLAILESRLKDAFEIVTAANGLDALEKLEKVEPDLVILDVSMPCLNGLDTALSIRKNLRFRDVPIIFLTAADDPESRARGHKLSAALYLTKPFSPTDLRERLMGYVSQNALSPRPKRFTVDQILAAERDGFDLAANRRTPTPEERDPPPQQTEATAAAPPKARVLVVDDEPDIVYLIESFLVPRYEVFSATHSLEALQKIIELEPDLILLDIEMPNLSGYQLSQLLRLNRTLRTIKIMFVSSRDESKDIEYGYRLGAAGYLTKPFAPDELLRRVDSIVSQPEFSIRPKKRSEGEIKRSRPAGKAGSAR